jgi:mono/diheme cytochrome c family protein
VSNDPNLHSHDEARLVEAHDELLQTKETPTAGSESLSPWLIAAFLGIAFVGTGYLFWNSGGFKATVFNPSRVAWDGSGGATAAPPDPKVIGKRVFTQNCAVCHQANGLGVAGQFPPLVGSEWVLGGDWHGDNHLVKIVLHGLQGPVTVLGKPYNNAMAPWGAVLDDSKVAAVLTYIRSEWGNNAPPVPPEFVAKVREETKARNEPWTQKLLQATEKVMVGDTSAAPVADPAAPAPGT